MSLSPRKRLRKRATDTARRRFWTEDGHDRESYVCPCCGYEAQGKAREFDVHHRDEDWLNNHPMNLVAVCQPCHRYIHRANRQVEKIDDWKAEFRTLRSLNSADSGSSATQGGGSA